MISDRLVSTSSQEGLRPFEIDYILKGFEESIQKREHQVTPAHMHRCLATFIESVVGTRDESTVESL